jgi:NitT/TauT family transport system substrate-binding protein
MKTRILSALGYFLLALSIWPLQLSAVEKAKIASGGHLVHFAPLDLAVAKGMFTAAGLDVEVVQLQSGTPVAQALLSGQVDFSMNGIDHAFKAAVQGKPDMKMILLLNRVPGMSLVADARLKDSIRSIADFKGRALAVTSKGAATHMVLASLLQKAGISINDVTLVEVKPPTFAAALENQQIAGGIALEPVASALVEQGKVTLLADLHTLADTEKFMGGPYIVTGLMTRKDVLDKNPDLARKTAAVLLESLKWITTHSAQEIADAMPAEVIGSDKARYVKTMEKLKEFYSPDGVIPAVAVENVFQSMVLSGALPADTKLPTTDFYTSLAQLAGATTKTPESPTKPDSKGGWWMAAAALAALVAVVFLLRGKKGAA